MMDLCGLGIGSKKKFDDPVVEARPRAGMARRKREGERCSRAGVLLIVGLLVLPFVVYFLFGGQSSASDVWQSAAKLTAMGGGLLNASPASVGTGATEVDEHFHGLLAPVSDRRTCLSRHQSPQYYRHHPYPPSSYLLYKLRDYEARHKKCGPGTPLYAKFVEQLRSGAAATDAECSYLVWIPYNGLGNRVLSLLSTFLYALLTGRVLLVHSTDDFSDLFCEPFPGATWVLPPDFPVANLTDLGVASDDSYGNHIRNGKLTNDPAKSAAQRLPPYLYLHLEHGLRYTDQLFFCNDDQLLLARVPWLALQSDLYFVPSLHSVAAFHDELRRMFPAKESAAHLLARYLLHPTNTVWGLVTRFYHSYLAHAERRIGLQIRMFSFASIPTDDMYRQIMACSRQERILPEIAGGGNETGTGGAATTAVLIASLHADYYERIRTMYYEHPAEGGGRVGVFQPSHEGHQTKGQRLHNQKALAEIYLLSFSDVLLTSGMSTFGYMSSSLAGLRPAMLRTAFDHKVPETPCVRAVSMEPCFHYTPVVKCRGKGVNKDELARHVKVCEDVPKGIKLFD